jgi:uncharacterized protein (TIGR04551 family)
VERAKEEMRDEMRAEIQGQQSAREFMDTAAAGSDHPKLDFLQLNGYLRVRGDLLDNLDLRRDPDPNGFFLFPRPLIRPESRGTITTSNMRLRLEPTLNVSEQIRVMAQLDVLDNLVLGQTPLGGELNNLAFSSITQVPPELGLNSDRSSVVAKRAWAEVLTPLGLLSFGRMPSSWGMGILSHAGNGIDDDFGDSVDRLQFALLPLKTPFGTLSLIPMYEIVATGVTSISGRTQGVGQPFDVDQFDDAKALGIKIVHEDTEQEAKRKLNLGQASTSYGLWYMYKTQTYDFTGASGPVPPANVPGDPAPTTTGIGGTTATTTTAGTPVKRDAYAHVLDFWARSQTKKYKLEAEFVGVIGEIGNGGTTAAPLGPVLLRQFGGAVNGAWNLGKEGKFTISGELGIASGDKSPGFGYRTGRGTAVCKPDPKNPTSFTDCSFDGAQYAAGDRPADIRNFRFNPAYRVDMILFREIIGGVTDAWYLKPQLRWEVLDGLSLQASVIYSQAMYAESTPSTIHKPLGVELDVGATYKSEDGFIAFLNYGVLQPFSGMGYAVAAGHGQAPAGVTPSSDLSRAHAIRAGLAVKF